MLILFPFCPPSFRFVEAWRGYPWVHVPSLPQKIPARSIEFPGLSRKKSQSPEKVYPQLANSEPLNSQPRRPPIGTPDNGSSRGSGHLIDDRDWSLHLSVRIVRRLSRGRDDIQDLVFVAKYKFNPWFIGRFTILLFHSTLTKVLAIGSWDRTPHSLHPNFEHQTPFQLEFSLLIHCFLRRPLPEISHLPFD
jgi:hypothetical protein